MTSPTAHTRPSPTTATADPAWTAWSTAWTSQARAITGRPDATVTVAPGAGGGAPACCVPATATIEVNADLVGKPSVADPFRPGHKRTVPAAYGALIHECAHVIHSGWNTPPGTPLVIAEVANLLEESRAEHAHRTLRPTDRRWLRHAVTTIVAPTDTPTDTVWSAGVAAALLLARVDAKILRPSDVSLVRTAVTNVLGRKRLRQLRDIWRSAHTVADADATTMIDLAWQWCLHLGLDPTAHPDIPTDTATTSAIAAAVGAVIGHLTAAHTAPPAHRRRPVRHAHSSASMPLTWTPRPPTDAERAAARSLGARLRQAATREPVRRREATTTPPGRLRTRAALTAAAQRAAGTIPTVAAWQRTTRHRVPDPELAVAVLVDVSGSMRDFAKPLSSAAWIIAHAAGHARAKAAVIAFGDHVHVLVAPGDRPTHVFDMRADAGTEEFDQAAATADRLLDLSTPGQVRLVVIVSDGWFDTTRIQAQKTLDRLRATGCALLWLAPAGHKPHLYNGITPVLIDDPTTAITVIARAATKALADA